MSADLEHVIGEANRRWSALEKAQPLLIRAIELQRRFINESIGLLERLQEPPGLTFTTSAPLVVEKLRRGIPVLRGERFEIPVAILAPSLDRVCSYLATSNAGDVAAHLLEAFQSGRINRPSVLTASLGRNQRAIRAGAMQMGVAPDLVWLVGELATAPLAHVLRELFMRNGGAIVQAALEDWNRGYCPACGSWPAFAELIDGMRTLRCSYCAAQWRMHSPRCVYCGRCDEAFRVVSPAPDTPDHVLELCDGCRGYTKAVQTGALTPFVLLPITDLETVALDRTAADCGYGRPPMIEIDPDETNETQRPCEGNNR